MIDPKLLPAIKLLWEFNQIEQKLESSDFILVLGSSDLKVPKAAASIYKQGFSNRILVSGGFGRLTKDLSRPEAEVFAEVLIQSGVPQEDIIIENKSTNTGENIRFSYELANKNNLKTDTIILVTKSYMGKRATATFKKQWPNQDTKLIVYSANQTFEELLQDPDILEHVSLMVGDTQRLKIYPKMGFMAETEIPEQIWQAFELLASNGFDKDLV